MNRSICFRCFLLFLTGFCIVLPGLAQNVRYNVLVDEFLADPSPSIGLPSSSFIELKNVSGKTVDLHNWKISNGSTTSSIKTGYLLAADSFLILCPAAAEDAYQAFGPALGLTGFPSLNHENGEIILLSEDGNVIHALQYDKSWFHNELKSGGGWSLEMIDLKNPCAGMSNWTASDQETGGTPGKTNSANAENPDLSGPELLRSITLDSLHVQALFSEPLDSISAAYALNYDFSPDLGNPVEALPVPPFYDRVSLTLSQPMRSRQVYFLAVQQVADCALNEISGGNTCSAGLPEPPAAQDIIFNEILFNPPSYGYDYVEIYNRSTKPLDLQKIFLAGRDPLGAVKDPHQLLPEQQLLFPGEYAVLTESREWVLQHYTVAHPEKLFQLSSLPSMPDDLGTLLLLDESGQILDELSYDHHWHSPLLADEEGVSLERIQADQPTNLASNWASAASSAGFGTPTGKNSESFADAGGKDLMQAEPKIFSPDNDGYNDYCFIKYHLTQNGFTANISIYDINGRAVRRLANNSTISTDGSFRWDGLDDALNPLPMGHYVICVDLFTVTGKIKKFKLVVVLAKRY
jgi:hypothetical protein